jgi:ABC-2 type transport system permease protein
VLPVLLALLYVLAKTLAGDPGRWAGIILHGYGLVVLLPVAALVMATSSFGPEIADGSIVHVLAKPIPRSQIVLSRALVAFAAIVLVAGVPLAVVGALIGGARLGVGMLAATIVGAVAYTGVFTLLGIVSRRAITIGLVYVLIWEGLLCTYVPGARVLSVQEYAMSVGHQVSGSPLLHGSVALAVALGMPVLLTVAGAGLAIRRLRALSVVGDTG